jgi:hypothetical protein
LELATDVVRLLNQDRDRGGETGGGENLGAAALTDMSDTNASPITREALDEFIRQLFVCHWVLGQMIDGMVRRARSNRHDAHHEPDDAYSLIRTAIGGVVDRHGAQQIAATTRLVDEVMDAISDDRRIFPPDPAVVAAPPDRSSLRSPVRRRRR